MELKDLKIIVTGGAQGMGAHFVRRLAEAGATVTAGDVKEDALRGLAESIAEVPAKVPCGRPHFSAEAAVVAFVGWAPAAMGGPTALVNTPASPRACPYYPSPSPRT